YRPVSSGPPLSGRSLRARSCLAAPLPVRFGSCSARSRCCISGERSVGDRIWVSHRYVDGASPLLIVLVSQRRCGAGVSRSRQLSSRSARGVPLNSTFAVRSARGQGTYLDALHNV